MTYRRGDLVGCGCIDNVLTCALGECKINHTDLYDALFWAVEAPEFAAFEHINKKKARLINHCVRAVYT